MKVKANTITTITKAAIEKELIELETLLEGRLDINNIHSTSAGTTSIGKASFSDVADFSSPIYSDKFFGMNATDMAATPKHAIDFYEDIFQDLLFKSYNSDTYSTMTQKCTITMNYKNQVNLEKPTVVISQDSQLTLEQQRTMRSEFIRKREEEYQAWLNRDVPNASILDILLGSLVGGFAGSISGAAGGGIIGGPVGAIAGAFVGGIAGTFAGAVGANTLATSGMPSDTYLGTYDSHAANTQFVIFKHPPNYRMVSTTEVIDRLTVLLEGKVRYTEDFTELNRKESELLPCMSVRVSAESKLGNNLKDFYSKVDYAFSIDAETTAVAVTIMPVYDTEELIESEDDYITFLAEVDLLFKEIT